MADTCVNWLTVTGLSSQELDQMKQLLKSDTPNILSGKYDAFDFEKVLPVPKERTQTWGEWVDENWGSTNFDPAAARWECSNMLRFHTRNEPPNYLLKHLSSLYPPAKFELRFASDANLQGYAIYRNGDEVYHSSQFRDNNKWVTYSKATI